MTRPTYPLGHGRVFGTQTIRESVVVWKGPHVASINEALGLGGDVFTEETRDAVLAVQGRNKRLMVTGVVDRRTWGAIFR